MHKVELRGNFWFVISPDGAETQCHNYATARHCAKRMDRQAAQEINNALDELLSYFSSDGGKQHAC